MLTVLTQTPPSLSGSDDVCGAATFSRLQVVARGSFAVTPGPNQNRMA
jgi:hypothetical protein